MILSATSAGRDPQRGILLLYICHGNEYTGKMCEELIIHLT